MMQYRKNQGQLAVLGGTPIAPGLSYPTWPPQDDQTAAALLEVYWSGQWSFGGKHERAFASAFATYHGAEYGVFVANGSVALQCALQACGVQRGDEVIVPACSWPTTALAANEIGAIPVLVDVDPFTLCLDVSLAEEAITERTRAIIPVHLYGSMADLDALGDLASRYDLKLIEDCAHVPGGMWRDRGVGSWGDVGTFSFNQIKGMSCGEGGICITKDAVLADLLYRCKHMGYSATDRQFKPLETAPPHDFLCHNFRATEFQAVILAHQLEQLGTRISKNTDNASRLREALEELPGIRVQAAGRLASPQSYFGLIIIFDGEPLMQVPLGIIMQALAAEGLVEGIQGVYRTYGPIYKHTLFTMDSSRYRIANGDCPMTEQLAAHALVLPHQWLNADEPTLERLISVFRKVSQQARHLLTQV